MALQLDFEHQGETANYWKIMNTKHDYVDKTSRVLLALFRSAETRAASPAYELHVEMKRVTWIGDTVPDRAAQYVAIKLPVYFEKNGEEVQMNPFFEAEDV